MLGEILFNARSKQMVGPVLQFLIWQLPTYRQNTDKLKDKEQPQQMKWTFLEERTILFDHIRDKLLQSKNRLNATG